jgi:hypothetical protein
MAGSEIGAKYEDLVNLNGLRTINLPGKAVYSRLSYPLFMNRAMGFPGFDLAFSSSGFCHGGILLLMNDFPRATISGERTPAA